MIKIHIKVIGMSLKMKEAPNNEEKGNKTSEFYEDEELHQHVEHYESMIIEKNNEIKGIFHYFP